ncbi:hypothetical protein FSP39_018598 [Pinctada imbricata]|uniref:EF-hand domain-containing protein n=1 Tax=Pinctada imbricata TaxID=66713 RepID=A0AA88XXD1_PINIB|nr:hypothetical protein FSP39_018598 [Pinctada imbricata]
MFIALGGYIGDRVYRRIYLIPDFNPNAGLERTIGEDGVTFFRQYDRDSDSHLSMDEFEAMYYRFLGEGLNVTSLREYTQPIDVDDEVVTAKAYFQPLVLNTMTKDLNESIFSDDLDSLVGLRAWREKSKEWLNAGVKHFVSFLPREDSFITEIGSVYDIYRIDTGLFALFDTQMTSSNRYFPPNVEDNLVLIHRLLTMFHPRPFLRSRFAPQGAIATVRAYNDKYIDIVFRIHAEYQINEPPHYPFWFTPAQFKGNLVISRDYKHIVHFNMYVPTDKRLNIDMEWLNGPQESENMEVDIGFLPQMEINITGPSVPYQAGVQDTPIPGGRDKIDKELSSIKWTKEITMHQAERNLEIHLYPFKKDLEKDSHQPEYSKVAAHFLENYKFPVMMMVALPNGTILHKVNANEFMDDGGGAEGEDQSSILDSISLGAIMQKLNPRPNKITASSRLGRKGEMCPHMKEEIEKLKADGYEGPQQFHYMRFLQEGFRRAQLHLPPEFFHGAA